MEMQAIQTGGGAMSTQIRNETQEGSMRIKSKDGEDGGQMVKIKDAGARASMSTEIKDESGSFNSGGAGNVDMLI